MEKFRFGPKGAARGTQQETANDNYGHLRIFFSYAEGTGKTYAMLQAAREVKAGGADVVIGYIGPHIPPATAALLDGFERIPFQKRTAGGVAANEFDIDAALTRHPQLIVMDELAHTNASGCRHKKRYQDIRELLKAGIDVYATLNVQQIESLNDVVASITGELVKERVPDFIFDDAHQVELVDIEPEELVRRREWIGLYRERQAGHAESGADTEKLATLRKLAVRCCADRVNFLCQSVYHADEHILVCLSPAPSNAKIVRTAARMAAAFHGSLTALFVETSEFSVMSDEDKQQFRANIHLAEQLGASIETIYGEDVSYQIAEFARLSGISKIVIGRSSAKRRGLLGPPALTDQLIKIAPNLDIYVIPDPTAGDHVRERRAESPLPVRTILLDAVKCGLILGIATLVGLAFSKLGFTEANIITVYILGVLITAVVTRARIFSLIASAASVMVFNFFFTVPKFTFMVYSQGYPVTFLIMFFAALLTSTLTTKLKFQAKQAAQAAFRTKILLDTNQLLQKAPSDDEIITIAAKQLVKLLNRDLVFYPVGGELGEPRIFPVKNVDKRVLSDAEKEVAAWVMKNNKAAGATTNTLGGSQCLYLPVQVNESVYGVVGVHLYAAQLDHFELSVLLSILGECALALENSRNSREKEAAAVLAKNEQLRADLLRAISHDLRTPLTSISGNASNLLSSGTELDMATREQIYTDIYDDAMWLITLVENLLSVTRIDEGRMNLNFSLHLVEEIIAESLRHINRKSVEHHIEVAGIEGLLLVKIDARLIIQVLINILDNAIKYTPVGSTISISAQRDGGFVAVSVADDGPGIPDDMKARVFDMFYSGASNKVADSHRSLGLGLSLCKSIITAHNGEITVRDNEPRGAVFTFTLPIGEVELYE